MTLFGEGTSPRLLGRRRGLVEESFPDKGEVQGTVLSDVAHMREGVLQFSKFSVDPALTATVAREVRFEKRLRIHLRAAFTTFHRAKFLPV